MQNNKDSPYLNKEAPGLWLTLFVYFSSLFLAYFLHFKLCGPYLKVVNKG